MTTACIDVRTVTTTLRHQGHRIVVTLTLTDFEGPATTVGHEEVDCYTRLLFTGEVFNKHAHHPFAVGQVQEYLPSGALRNAWDRWNLNDLRTHCEHQPVQVPWDECLPCVFTGYRAGSAWLLEPVGEDDIQRLLDLFA